MEMVKREAIEDEFEYMVSGHFFRVVVIQLVRKHDSLVVTEDEVKEVIADTIRHYSESL